MTSDNKKKNHFKQIAGILISLLLAAIFLYIASYGVNLNQVVDIVSQASWFWIFVLIVVFLLSHYLRALRWKVILISVKPDLSILNLFGSLMVGYGMNCAVPRLGEVSRAVLLGKWERISRSSILGTIIVERVIDMIVLAIAVVISVYIWSGNLYESFPWLESTLYIVSAIMACAVIFLFLLIRMKERFYKAIISFISKFSEKLAHKLAYIFEMLTVGFASLKGTKNYFLTILLSILLMLNYAVTSYVGFLTIGMQNIMPVTFGMGWILMSISAIGIVIPTPGGTGSYHTLAKSVIVLLFGFSEEVGLAYAFLTHGVTYVFFVLSALLFFFWLNNKNYKRYGDKESIKDLIETKMEDL